ncbi:MAG: hypothetical protein NHB14_20705 [Desulfosporosinus sp.]|nr:hypothetical protein [Desulfosporosinus sp.]
MKSVEGLENYVGQPIELWYGGKRWFMGFLTRRRIGSDGAITYMAYDPLYFFKRNTDDWYFVNSTATQAFGVLASRSGIRVAGLANTGVVFPALYYPGAVADKVGVDLLARTIKGGGKKYWFRYQPDDGNDGLILFEKLVPPKIWAFQVGINLVNVSKEESLDDTATVVKLVNRETGKVVVKTDAVAFKQFGQLVHFEEVDKDQASTMEAQAIKLLEDLKKVAVTMSAEGVNPDQVIPQLFSGDAIYVEEPVTGLVGGYYIRNVSHSFEGNNLIKLNFDITIAPDVPALTYESATDKPKSSTGSSEGKGVQQAYSAEVTDLLSKYGI